MIDLTGPIHRAAALIRRSQFAVALTGAGVSTPSGIPDFRSANSGLWANADPMEVASMAAFRYHPERFYAWVRPLVMTIRQACPNPAHHALSKLEAASRLKCIITQNIDELHTRAGSQQVLEIHGHLREAVCGACHRVWPGEPILTRFIADGRVPRCPECGGVLKPQVILMGEQLAESVVRQARAAVRRCDLMLVAGSSLEVLPCAAFPHEAAMRGARLIIVNLEPTYMDERADVVIHADVAEVLPQIAAATLEEQHA